jgi:Concanavalin A-like lectin/glucanases superfamily
VVRTAVESFGWACLLTIAASCGEPPQLALTGAAPSMLVQGEETTVEVSGRNFSNALSVNLDNQSSAVVNKTWQLQIGALAVSPERIQLVNTDTLSVVLPRGLPLGTHDLVVISPAGARATLSPGLTVTDGPQESTPPSAGNTAVNNPPTSSASRTSSSSSSTSRTSSSSSASLAPVVSSAASSSQSSDPDASAPELSALQAALIHRYSFEQPGGQVTDSVGGAHGTFIGAGLDGTSGAAQFTGVGEYIDLPNALISGLGAVTIEVWMIWDAPNQGNDARWQRVFDFGSNNDAPEGQPGTQDTHLFLTPRSGGTMGTLHLAYRGDLTGSVTLNGTKALEADVLQHVVAVVDGVGGQMALYVDGAWIASRTLDFPLSLIADHNNWLGRSQLADDPAFQGRIFEFRIYDSALDAGSIGASYAAGPDAVFAL